MIRCWQLIRILVRTNHPCLRVERHIYSPLFGDNPSIVDYMHWFAVELPSLSDVLAGVNENFVSARLERALAMAGDSGYLAVLQAFAVDGGVDVLLGEQCDRTTLEMRGLSPKIISGDSQRSENAQTYTHKHTISNMKFNLKLLQIKCHVLGFIKGKAQKMLQRIIRVFAEAFVSHDRHTLFALEESGPSRTTYTCESK
jgi:hypothetical protein